MICPCHQPLHILLSKYYDQLAPDSIKSITIKLMKTSTYSTQFQMHDQRVTFNILDSFSFTYFHHSNFISKLSAESEASSLMNHMDINALLGQLTE